MVKGIRFLFDRYQIVLLSLTLSSFSQKSSREATKRAGKVQNDRTTMSLPAKMSSKGLSTYYRHLPVRYTDGLLALLEMTATPHRYDKELNVP